MGSYELYNISLFLKLFCLLAVVIKNADFVPRVCVCADISRLTLLSQDRQITEF